MSNRRGRKAVLEERLKEFDEGRYSALKYHSRRINEAKKELEEDSDLDDDEIEEVINIIERYVP